ncbi:ParB/RepB/Spo0J family partition protein [Solirubrobacter sp. CPCC 204708]|uniref:ParB/RepB/Spo0J family partition protein n=1 Tax=Solirubrobacter deserti TaxID=2282478 RepID=A0ABT4RLH3_9ACTN|nr:ParB/RepB/Spo0J family partition protein [Solirubrobacter deserti]MBE2320387.1 ParB/RepB/Spo0J family partition protein [Solirubrobacter deserti]MDA0139418.1 ParB/RepB/Spo0J family partition protein [Solirubrobacter deserti]
MSAQLRISLDRIRVAENVRALDPAHVDALAASIALQGLLVPLVVCPSADGEHPEDFDLVAGFHRHAAATQLGLAEVEVVVRDGESEDADRAVENIARKALDPREEARAVQAMLARGLSEDGAAQALGWSPRRVAARVKLLHLPDAAQAMVGEGAIALSAVDQLLAIGQVSAPLLDAVLAYLADGNGWAAERLAREPGWVLDSALRHGDTKVFAAHLNAIRADTIAELRLGKKTDALYQQACVLYKQLDRHAWGTPEVRFSDEDVDQARAAGVLVEFERSRPVIVDRGLYRELTKTAIKRAVAELEARVAAAAAEKAQSRTERLAQQADDPLAAAARERDSALRELADQAHGANLDLGQGLLDGLSVVDPADMRVARFFVYALLGPDFDASPYTQTGERVQRLAANGIRLVIGEFRTDVTKTRKDGSPGRLRIDYGDSRNPEAPVKWLWRYLDGAKTAGELYGRALVVIAAEHYASRLVLPTAQRMPATRFGSRTDTAAKALGKLCGPHLPASLERLEQAVNRAHATYAEAEQAHRAAAAAASGAAAPAVETDEMTDHEADDSAEENEPDDVAEVEPDTGPAAGESAAA